MVTAVFTVILLWRQPYIEAAVELNFWAAASGAEDRGGFSVFCVLENIAYAA